MMLAGQIEYQLLIAAKRLVGTNLKKARVMFATLRWDDYVERIEDLADVSEFDLRISDLAAICADLRAAEKRRNLLAHSAWFHDGPKVYVQWTRGNYQPPGMKGKVKRVLYPEGIEVDVTFRRESLTLLKKGLASAKRLVKATESLVPVKDAGQPRPHPKITK